MHLLEHGQDGHRVHGGDQAAEQEEIQQPNFQVSCKTGRAIKESPSGPRQKEDLGVRHTFPPWPSGGLPQAVVLLTAGLEAPQDRDSDALGSGAGQLWEPGSDYLPPSRGPPQPSGTACLTLQWGLTALPLAASSGQLYWLMPPIQC